MKRSRGGGSVEAGLIEGSESARSAERASSKTAAVVKSVALASSAAGGHGVAHSAVQQSISSWFAAMPTSVPAIEHDCDAPADAGDGAPSRDSATSSERMILVTRTRMGTRSNRVKSHAVGRNSRPERMGRALSNLRRARILKIGSQGLTFQWLEPRYGVQAEDQTHDSCSKDRTV